MADDVLLILKENKHGPVIDDLDKANRLKKQSFLKISDVLS